MFPSVLPTYNRADVAFARGEGAYLFAEDGSRYLDFGAGIAVNAFGHANPRLVAALTEQAKKLWHTSNLYRVPGQEKLSRKLVDATFADTVFFTNSGAEACECAFKIARRYQFVNGHPERFRIITFAGAFHGRTLAGIAAGGQEKYLEGFGPKVEGFDQVPPNDLKALEAAITDATAALMVEPIQGEGGLHPMPPEFLRALRKLCDERGLMLIFDEIQCGFGRTGKLFAHEWVGVTPDIMCVAKGIGGGFPLGACLATAEAAKGMTTGTHGSTYGGNPLAMAVGTEAATIVLEPGFLESVQATGNFLRQQLVGLIAEHPGVFEELRGQGLMLGLKLKVPNTEFVAAARQHGLLIVGAGENVVRLLPPLILTEEEAREGVALLSKAAADFETDKTKKTEAAA
ncbi:MAG TPA: aspartate aminotransferase family protein [Rhizomicrobium sp.]|nr:aspartate aminotransferase family protein [Rhizomicrobium sp.]